MPSEIHEIRLPELGLGNIPITVSCWLVPSGTLVIEGDRLIEVLAGDVTVDLSAPATGKLLRRQVVEGESVTTGQVLGMVRAKPDQPRQTAP
jgi:pyruvate/2-oxoglutarate dehydrogenase complex dihydrolipoamide acyltransferase (E2) component